MRIAPSAAREARTANTDQIGSRFLREFQKKILSISSRYPRQRNEREGDLASHSSLQDPAHVCLAPYYLRAGTMFSGAFQALRIVAVISHPEIELGLNTIWPGTATTPTAIFQWRR